MTLILWHIAICIYVRCKENALVSFNGQHCAVLAVLFVSAYLGKLTRLQCIFESSRNNWLHFNLYCVIT